MTYIEHEPQPTINNVIFDLDSTLSFIEGIDELGRFKGVEDLVAPLTTDAMNGIFTMEEVFFKRLDVIQPTYEDLITLGHLYCQTITPGAQQLIHTLRRRNIHTFIVSGGYKPAVNMIGNLLGIPDHHIYANELEFNPDGTYRGVRLDIPLWKNSGKHEIITHIRNMNPGTYAFVGDSKGDMLAGQLTERAICFAGIVERPAATHIAHAVVRDKNILAVLPFLT